MSPKSIPEVFNCCICIQTLTNAVICPHCSKMCCYDCIKTWIDSCNNTCPHCRKNLNLDDFVRCRWAQEVIEQWRLISDVPKDVPDVCPLHDKKKKIFCSTCTVPLCQYCALWSADHKDHVFRPLEDVYFDSRKTLSSQLEQVSLIIKELESKSEDISSQIVQIEAIKISQYKDIRNMVAKSFERLDEIELIKVNELNERAQHIGDMIESLNKLVGETQEKLDSLTYIELISQSEHIGATIKKSVPKFPPLPTSEEIIKSFSNEYVPQFGSKIFVLNNFSSFQRGRQAVFSDVLTCDGLGWRLKVYPNGNGEVEGTFLSLFVELAGGLRGSSRFDYKLELLNSDESRNIKRVYTSEFEVGECWGYTRFCRLGRLEGSGFINNDSLAFRLNVRSPTYYHKCMVLESYIQRLTDLNSSGVSMRENVIALGVTNQGDVNEVCEEYSTKWDSTEGDLTDEMFSDFSAEGPMDIGDIF